jgi:hypothetical protein
MDAALFLAELQLRGLTVTVDVGNLVVKPRRLLTDNDRTLLRKHKQALVEILAGEVKAHQVFSADPSVSTKKVPPPALTGLTEPHPEWEPPPPLTELTGPKSVALPATADFGPDLAPLVSWFQQARVAGRLPGEPFILAPWQKIINPALFYASLELDIATGSRGSRARFGGLTGSLRRLKAFVERPGADAPADSHPDGSTRT